nr:sugar ABC transporter permease [Chloroflexota bacterium]
MSTSVITRSQDPKAPAARISSWRQISKKMGPYLFLLPATLFLAAFLLYPVCTMVLYSFQEVNIGTLLTGDIPFVGLANYQTIVTDPVFRSALGVSLEFTVGSLVFQFGIGFLLALLFSKPLPLVGIMRGSIMIAWM